jgi:integrase
MPMKMQARSVAKLKPADAPYYVSDALIKGLGVRVAIDGSKSWSFRYRIGRRMRRLTLGDVSLADARELAKAALKQVAKGEDPAEQKRERREAPTVGDFAKTFIEVQSKKNKSWRGAQSQLNNIVLPKWKHRLVKDVTRQDVRDLVEAVAARPAPILANRVRALLSRFFNVAIERDVIEANPVVRVPRPGFERRRDRVLTHDEIRKFWTACDGLPLAMAAFYKLRLLTAQRGGEVASMRWQDVDLDAGWWTIPAAQSKNKLSHRVSLSSPAVRIIASLYATADADDTFVIATARGKLQQRLAARAFALPNFRGHDLRRTAASLMAGSGVPRLVISKILNHAEPGVTAIYDRHGYDAEKRIALDGWGRTLTAIVENKKDTNVVAFARS